MRFHYFVQNGEANEKEVDPVKRLAAVRFRDSQIMRIAWEQLSKVCAADVLGCGKPYASTGWYLSLW